MGFVDLFPTVIYIENLKNLFSFNFDLWVKHIKNLPQGDTSKEGHVTNSGQILNDDIFKSLKKYIINIGENYCKEIGHKIESLQISNSWANFNPNDTFIHEHNHSNSYLSGVFHLTDSSDIVFINPHKSLWHFIAENNGDKNNYRSWDTYPFTSKKGQLILFPSHLKHFVDSSYNDRLSIAFNLIPKGDFGPPTAYINL